MKEKSITPKDGLKTKQQAKNTSRRLAKKALIKARRLENKRQREEQQRLNPSLWEDRKVAVLASGPSLTLEDAVAVRDAGFLTVVVNTAYTIAPWYDILYAGDTRWWKAYGDGVVGTGKRYSRSSHAAKKYGAKVARSHLGSDYNSGELAIEFACLRKPQLIVLLGFDCSIRHGVHFHGPHKRTPNPNTGRCQRWEAQFSRIPEKYPTANIINCSRYTELDCFPRAPLESVL